MDEQNVEIVERKGQGHPDYMIDASAESLSRALCKFYLQNFGAILHHNVDKGLLVGGRSSPRFGGGEVEEPIQIIIAGRAVTEASKGSQKIKVPLDDLAIQAVNEFISKNFRFLDPKRHVVVNHKIKQGSVDLVKIFNSSKKVPRANDTSFGVGYAPLTETERLVLETERYLNSTRFKKQMPEVGEDIKIMGMRYRNKITLTIAAAMISTLIPDKDHYLSVKEEVKKRVEDFSTTITEKDVDIFINAGDNPKADIYYLTVTGTSAEGGDDGNLGRGNRVNGLITPWRQMSLEATAGKNPVNHVGKTYNVQAKLMAERIYNEVKGVGEVYVKILSRIGNFINEPQLVHVQVSLDKGYALSNVSPDIKAIADEELANFSRITEAIMSCKVDLF